MLTLLTIIHVLAALILILVVLLQSARGTDMAGAFGGMGSQTAFGPRGTTTFLSKTTAALAAVFMVTSLSLAVLSNRYRSSNSILKGEKAAPAAPQSTQPLQGAPEGIKQSVIPVPASGSTPAAPATAPAAGTTPEKDAPKTAAKPAPPKATEAAPKIAPAGEAPPAAPAPESSAPAAPAPAAP